jgi:hypothetical protein
VVVVVVAAGVVVEVDVPLTTEVEVVAVVEVAGNGGRLVAGVVSEPRQDATRKASTKRSQIRLIRGEAIDGPEVANPGRCSPLPSSEAEREGYGEGGSQQRRGDEVRRREPCNDTRRGQATPSHDQQEGTRLSRKGE